MLSVSERDAIADQFGVAIAQVRRDHLISHLLAALSAHVPDKVIFFGGTALSRSLVPNGRLSEDIDLIADGDRREVADLVETWLVRATRREFPRLRWQPLLTAVRNTQPAVLTSADGITVRVQLLSRTGYPAWPVESQSLEQRYSDAPAAVLRVPTSAAFAAWKTVAWMTRGTARDLFDLWLLTHVGAIDDDAAALFVKHGPTNQPPADYLFREAPAETDWRRDLGSQTRLTVSAAEALAVVRSAWAAVVGR